MTNDVAAPGSPAWHRNYTRPWTLLRTFLVLLSAALMIYSQTLAFVWDEGFHLVAAQLISQGETPYIDFLFPQTLLNAYFNAGVLRIFGPTWHAVHVFDSLFVSAAIWLTATYVMRRFPVPGWKLPCAIVCTVLVGWNEVVVAFGPSAQAYGSGLLLLVAAFRVAVVAVDRPSPWPAFFTALLAGAAAGSTLLTVPALPVLLIWMLLVNRAGARRQKLIAFCLGVLIPFLPEAWLFLRAPQLTLFNVVRYQALFRRMNWGDVGAHDFDVFLDWTESAQALLLGLLGAIGLVYLVRGSHWPTVLRRELYLAAALAFGMGAFIAIAHPTFGRYFIFLIPFIAILATVGFYYVGSRLVGPDRPAWSFAVLLLIFAGAITKYVFDDRDSTNWHDYEKIAAKIKEVTPPGQEYMADDMIYFLLKQRPPRRMEFSYSHKLDLPKDQEDLYGVISFKELKQQIAKGRFATVESCKDEVIDDLDLDNLFPHKQDFDDCSVFWRNRSAKDKPH